MAACRGQVVLVVNVASFCGHTVQYVGLEKLHREFAPRGFAVLGRSGKAPKRNFGKSLVGKDGQVVDLFHPGFACSLA